VNEPGLDQTSDCCPLCVVPLVIMAIKFRGLRGPLALWTCPSCALMINDVSAKKPRASKDHLFNTERYRSLKEMIAKRRRPREWI
jgi:hypothetical protein